MDNDQAGNTPVDNDPMDKARVAAILDDVGDLMELRGDNPFEARAYHNAARAVGGLDGDLAEMVGSGAIEHVPGLGKTLAKRVAELVTTGHLAIHDDLLAEIPAGLRAMLRIPGLGPKRVRQIHDTLAITTLDDLKAAAEGDRIAGLPGFGKKSQENILKGLAFLSEHLDHYLFPVAEADAEAIAGALRALPQVVRLSIAGSLRRRKEIVKDVDMVASVAADADRQAVMGALVALPQVADVIGRGETKTSVILRAGMAMDFRLVTDDEFPYALHHFSGSKDHNVALRTRAHAQGIKINEYGLFRGEERIPAKDEREFYAALGMAYVEPEMREDRGEIELALKGELPTLVTDADLRGILHVHSTWSDGQVSIREMAEAAMALGATYLGICDHSQVAAYAGGLNPAAVRRQHDEIDQLNADFGARFRILKGTECDILKDGQLDYDDATLATFDFVVASIHSHFQLAPAEQTQRLMRALDNPYTSILGHPTGRLLLQRDGYAPDLEAVIDHAGTLGVAIELNCDPHRAELDWRLHRRAVERGILIPIDPDAHSPAGLGNIRYGVGLARKGWLTAADVLNTRPVEDLVAFFAAQRQRRGV
jgi:DNA polymerase (family 10)